MKLACPSCGAIASAEAWLNDADARQALKIAAEMPSDVSRRALFYVAYFRPPGGRGLTWSRALRLLSELSDLVSAGHVQWGHGPARPAPAGVWAEAIERMIARPPRQLPLKNHNYLRAIAWEQADDADRAEEVKRNEAERAGVNPATTRVDTDPERIDLDWMKSIRRQKFPKPGRKE